MAHHLVSTKVKPKTNGADENSEKEEYPIKLTDINSETDGISETDSELLPIFECNDSKLVLDDNGSENLSYENYERKKKSLICSNVKSPLECDKCNKTFGYKIQFKSSCKVCS